MLCPADALVRVLLRTKDVDATLDSVAEYVELCVRRKRFGGRLAPELEHRFRALERMLRARSESPRWRSPRRFTRHPVKMRGVVLPPAGEGHEVIIENISGGGLCVKPAPYLELGARAMVSVESDGSDDTYVFPVRLRWLHRGPLRSAMGMQFVTE